MNPSDKEQLRHKILEALTIRHPAALTRAQILNRVAMEVDFAITFDDIDSALEFLLGLHHVDKVADQFGSTQYWHALSNGILAVERSQRPNRPRHD